MIISSLKSSWFLGKGSKAFNNGYYKKALRYFLYALENAKKTDSSAEVAVRMEAIAETYLKLDDYNKARSYAYESLEIYNKFLSNDNRGVFKKAINRVKKLLDEITYREKEKSKVKGKGDGQT
jgi:tetratricopeptide (TPR) repeat protein